MNMKNQLSTQDFMISFEGDNVRRKFIKGEWWFSIADVCGVLADTTHGETYWRKLKSRDEELMNFQSRPNWAELKLIAKDGRSRKTECSNLEGILRIIQSIPSTKAEPFKRWLAQVGNERVEEVKNPSKAIERGIDLYRKQGRSEEWIKARSQSIAERKELASELQQRGVSEGVQFAVLTNDMTQQAFGMKVKEYEEYKGIPRGKLRDNMTTLELLVNTVGEATMRELHRQNASYGMAELRDDAIKGGRVAKNLRNNMEQALGRSIITSKNYLPNKDI